MHRAGRCSLLWSQHIFRLDPELVDKPQRGVVRDTLRLALWPSWRSSSSSCFLRATRWGVVFAACEELAEIFRTKD